MTKSIEDACKDLVAINALLQTDSDLVELFLKSPDVESLLIAIAMALAYEQDAIVLDSSGELHLMSSIEEINKVIERSMNSGE